MQLEFDTKKSFTASTPKKVRQVLRTCGLAGGTDRQRETEADGEREKQTERERRRESNAVGNSNVHRVIYETFRANDTKFYKVIEISPDCDLVNVKEIGRGGNEQSRKGRKMAFID